MNKEYIFYILKNSKIIKNYIKKKSKRIYKEDFKKTKKIFVKILN